MGRLAPRLMPPHARPAWDAGFPIDVAREVKALRTHAAERGIPKRASGRLLLATWNIANLGVQKRTDPDYSLLAEIVSWFDIVAVQEVNDNLSGLRALIAKLPTTIGRCIPRRPVASASHSETCGARC